MKQLLVVLMLANAAIFVFGALLHAGVEIGHLHEPLIIPASIVETLCALALIWSAAAVLTGWPKARRAALIGNLVAISGVATGIVALSLGAGPRTASNDLYHGIMLALGLAAILALFTPAGRTVLKRH